MIKALLWDVDGTLAETERDGHRIAFNQAFEVERVPWRWSERRYGELLAVSGGFERLLDDMQHQTHAPSDPHERQTLAERLHRLKNEYYARVVARGELPLREGVAELLEDCDSAGVRMGIVTTTSRSNVEALLVRHLGRGWQARFAVIVSAAEAPKKKPDPQAYQLALAALRLRPDEVVAIEDSPAGVAAARAAGVPVIVTRSHYFPSTPGLVELAQGVLAAGASLGRPEGWRPEADAHATRVGLEQIAQWYAGGD